MKITEVRIKLIGDTDDRLQAFCSITFDDSFVVRDLKIIDGSNGPFVAMPSRKLTSHCPQCGSKNHLRAAYCNQCGLRMKDDRSIRDQEGRVKLHADIAHPINSECREMIQDAVIGEYEKEIARSSEPGYISKYDEDYDADLHGEAPATQTSDKPDASSDSSQQKHEPPHDSVKGPHRADVDRTSVKSAQESSQELDDDDFGTGIF